MHRKRTDALQIKVFYGTKYARTSVDGTTWAPSRDKLDALHFKNGEMLQALREKTPKLRQDTLKEWGWEPRHPNAPPPSDLDDDTAEQLLSLGSGPETSDQPDKVDEEEDDKVDEEEDDADAASRFAGTRKCSRKQQQGVLPSHSQDPRAFKKPRQATTTRSVHI